MSCSFESINEENELLRVAFINAYTKLNAPPPDSDEYKLFERSKKNKKAHQSKKKVAKAHIVNENGELVKINPFDERCVGSGGFLKFSSKKECW